MSVTQLAFLGDSNVQMTGPVGSACTIAQGGKGGDYELAARSLARIDGIGPLLSTGIKGTWLADSAGDSSWSFTSGGDAWTDVATTDAFDRCLGKGKYGNGINKVGTYTHPTRDVAAVAFDVEYADYAAGGDFQWRKNGGTWANMGQTLAHDDQPAKFTVSTALAPGDTLDFRCYDGTSDCGCCLFGVRPWLASPASTQGFLYDVWAVNGTSLHAFLTSTAGDRFDIIDSVKLGTGSPRSNTPSAVVLQDLNDAARANTTEWDTDLLAVFDPSTGRFGSLPRGIISTWEAQSAFISTTNQSNYRAQTKTTAAATGAKVLDIYDVWAALGFTGNAGAIAAGFLNADNIHLSQNGHLDLWSRIYWFVRNLLGIGALPSSYPVIAKQPAVQYAGKLAAVQYSAGVPISV